MSTMLVFYYAIGIAATFGAAALAYAVCRRRGWSVPRWVLIVFLVLPAYLFVAQYLKFRSLHMYADVSHWLQIVHSIATTWRPETLSHEFIVPGTKNFLTVHFVPLVYLFGLLHRVWSAPEALLMSGVALMLSSAIPMYLMARRGVGSHFGMFAAAVFLWYPTFQYITLYEFEILRFSIPALLWMLYFWERRSTVGMLVFALLAAFVREEVGFTVMLFGVFLAIMERRRALGLTIAFMGIGVFAVTTTVIMPALSSAEQYVYYAAQALGPGSSFLDVVGNLVQHPFAVVSALTHPIKLANLSMLFLPLLAIPLFAPSVLIPAFASFGVGLLSTGFTNSSYMLYYMAPAVPFILYAFLRAWPRCITWLQRLSDSQLPSGASHRVHAAAMAAVLIGLLIANVFFGPSPIAAQFWSTRLRPAVFRTQSFHWSAYRVTDHHRAVGELIAQIPRDAIVSTQEFLLSRLYAHRGAMVYPRIVSMDGTYRATYILLDATNNGLHPESPAYVSDDAFAMVRTDSRWQRIAERNSFELYRVRSGSQ